MINTLKNTIVLISFILCFTSCDKVFQPEEDSQPEGDSQPVEDSQPEEDKKNYRYYYTYSETRSYSSHGELERTDIFDYEYDGHKMLSLSRTYKDEITGFVSTTYEKYEYSGLTCKCLNFTTISFVGEEANESSYEKTIEYLDDTYRHIRRSTTSRDGHIIEDTENTYDGKCIIQSKSQSYDYRNGEIVPSKTSITTYVTNGLHQVGECRCFDDNGNLTDIYSREYIYLNDEYWDYTEAICRYSSREDRTVCNYDDSGRLIEYRYYYNKELQAQQIYVYDEDNCTVSGFSGDSTIDGVSRYIKVPY